MIQNLLINAFDILVAGLLVVFLFLILLTVLTYGLVFLFPDRSNSSSPAANTQTTPASVSNKTPSLDATQQAAIAAAVHRYRGQHKP
ncbi:hypothetical protein CWE15_07160 [Aliidiomarina taiwanensis]|uniref:Oxaloacetate decarboxylase gamma chain n=1 Tax=Aliidiomarina taiwanensis TaxID=946228 RepID=A0A432X249_9GAMM|nr:OadG family transporter subunit [Aliidiomarina taiwanensis]RUO40528.1 hypothetical protein CWE15_07160 [Aliidiomarina taiwanensis]